MTFLGKTSRDKQPQKTPFPEKMGAHMCLFLCWVGGGGLGMG